jgi:hypothetical protein
MRKLFSLLIPGILVASTLVAISSTQASAAPTLTTCTNLETGKTLVLRIADAKCRSHMGSALWIEEKSGSPARTGVGYATMTVCSSKNSLFTYQLIKDACPKFQVTTNYWRTVAAPATPVIEAASARGHDSAVFTLIASKQAIAAPIVHYLITNIKTGQIDKASLNNYGELLVSNLSPLTSYTFTVSAVNVDGTSPASTITPVVTTYDVPTVMPESEPSVTIVGDAAKVSITRALVGTERRSAFTTQPQLTVQDSDSNTVSSSSEVITASITSGANGTLFGATTATAVNGIATFTNLGLDGDIGTTYTITYTAPGLTVATATVTLAGTTCDGSTFTCQVGDTGPGGGIVFYVAPTTFTQVDATGSMCTTNCKYLEAAPISGTSAWSDEKYQWSGDTSTAVGVNAQGTAIGTGYRNTLAMIAQNNTEGRAGTISQAYRGPNNLSDWYLSSRDELAQLYLQRVRLGLGADILWSSTEAVSICDDRPLSPETEACAKRFKNGNETNRTKGGGNLVRPIRAF